jgi:hypothetical protein
MFSITNGDLELRSVGEHLLLKGKHNTAEIIKWERNADGQFCYALAYWERGKEGYDLRFVGGAFRYGY